MAFEVLITDAAFADLDGIIGFIKQGSSLESARKWFAAVLASIDTLQQMPGRCPLTPESDELDVEVRVLLHGERTALTRSISASIMRRNRPVRSAYSTF